MVKEDSETWDLPGGGVKHGMNLHEALTKELFEEIDYQGDFSMQLVGVEVLERKQRTGYVMFIIYEVTLRDSYMPRCGKDTTDIQYLDPTKYEHATNRSLQMLYKYGTRNYDAHVSYSIPE